MFAPFKGGPDWVDEQPQAEAALDKWQAHNKEVYQNYIVRKEAWNWKWKVQHSTHVISHYFQS